MWCDVKREKQSAGLRETTSSNGARRQEFIVCHDYGQGAVWAVVLADSPESIKARFPAVEICESWPLGLDDATIAAIQRDQTFDIDNAPTAWLQTLDVEQPQ